MSKEQSTTEQVTFQKAIQLLSELCTTNNTQVTQLEGRIQEMDNKFTRTTAILEQLIMKLSNIEDRRPGGESRHLNDQEDEEEDNDSLSRPQLLNNNTPPTDHVNQVVPIINKAAITPLSSHSIIIPPSSSIPTFSGKHSERPKQFIIRIQEYAETVLGWDRVTLLTGISQFLRDTALDWHCQLKISGRQPQTWTEFIELFLSQFNSPIRSARQEQEWYECKQKEDETINEFIIRLRALWTEQKPKETEVDLVRHLFCKMRNDLLSMIGVPRGATLDEIILEAQKVEEVLYRRKKEERRFKYLNQNLSQNDTFNGRKPQNEVMNKQPKPYLTMNVNYPSNNRTTSNQRTTFNKRNMNQLHSNTNFYNRTTAELNNTEQLESMKCYNCGKWGHVVRNCPTNNSSIYRPDEGQQHSKNYGRAWNRRDTNARY